MMKQVLSVALVMFLSSSIMMAESVTLLESDNYGSDGPDGGVFPAQWTTFGTGTNLTVTDYTSVPYAAAVVNSVAYASLGLKTTDGYGFDGMEDWSVSMACSLSNYNNQAYNWSAMQVSAGDYILRIRRNLNAFATGDEAFMYQIFASGEQVAAGSLSDAYTSEEVEGLKISRTGDTISFDAMTTWGSEVWTNVGTFDVTGIEIDEPATISWFVSTAGNADFQSFNVYQIDIDAQQYVPEPATTCVLLGGLAGITALRSRRK